MEMKWSCWTCAGAIFAGILFSSLLFAANTSEGTSRKKIIPPPLKDLGKAYKVRLVYFVPTDKEAKPNYREKAEVLMRVVADVYRREMKANGQKTRGLDFEFDEDGKLKVHLVKGAHPSVFYTGQPFDVDRLLQTQQQETWEKTGYSRNRPTLCFSEAGAVAEAMPIPHIYSGFACVSGDIFRDEVTANTIEEQIENFFDETPIKKVGGKDPVPRNRESQTSNGVLSHELGHIFGMLHDTRDPRNIMMRGYDNLGQMYDPQTAAKRPVRFSRGHARMAAASRFFNESMNEQDTAPPEIHEFKLASPPKGGQKKMQITFNMSDDQGLGPLVVFQRGGGQIDAMVADVDLRGKKKYNKTVTLKCARNLLAGQPVIYIMNVFDKNGNLSQAQTRSVVAP
ncbi:MAG: hypothetical protein VXZ84_01020 [Planctomycetota bacterium]|nr:hypothetical protein [Planctomycetota bacterium]